MYFLYIFSADPITAGPDPQEFCKSPGCSVGSLDSGILTQDDDGCPLPVPHASHLPAASVMAFARSNSENPDVADHHLLDHHWVEHATTGPVQLKVVTTSPTKYGQCLPMLLSRQDTCYPAHSESTGDSRQSREYQRPQSIQEAGIRYVVPYLEQGHVPGLPLCSSPYCYGAYRPQGVSFKPYYTYPIDNSFAPIVVPQNTLVQPLDKWLRDLRRIFNRHLDAWLLYMSRYMSRFG